VADLIEHIRQLLADHRTDNLSNTSRAECTCSAQSLAHYSRLLDQRIVDCLDLRAEMAGNEICYVSAWFDDELTKLGGAEQLLNYHSITSSVKARLPIDYL